MWDVCFRNDRMTLVSGYPSHPPLIPVNVTSFIREKSDHFNSVYYFVKTNKDLDRFKDSIPKYTENGIEFDSLGTYRLNKIPVIVYKVIDNLEVPEI